MFGTDAGRTEPGVTVVFRPKTLACFVVLLGVATVACGHDWSAAGDAADAPDAEAAPDEASADADGRDDARVEGLDGDAMDRTEDAPGEDVPPVECESDPDCDDGNACTTESCDPWTGRCDSWFAADGTSCGDTGICCSGACVDSLDVAHCGSCSQVCEGGSHASPVCTEAGCSLACEGGFLDCSSEPDDGCETDGLTDEAYCGSCAIGCDVGQTCASGSCRPSWTRISDVNAPSARRYPVGIWTGSEMIVWGGHSSGDCFDVGGRYRPADDTWRSTAAPGGELSGICRAAVEWTGSELIVWSGSSYAGDSSPEPGGARYDPVLDGWTNMSRLGEPSPRMSAMTVWTGSEMIVWSGSGGRTLLLNDGGRYATADDHWATISSAGAPVGCWAGVAVWTGSEMIVWGGFTTASGGATNAGARYALGADGWTTMSTFGAPSARGGAMAAWTGRELLVWGGASSADMLAGVSGPLDGGGAYDPATNTWRTISSAGAPSARHSHTAVWTGDRMIVWGGTTAATTAPAFNTGAAYDPETDAWAEVTTVGAPGGRRNHVAVWTGTEMIVWGGATVAGPGTVVNLNDGARYWPP